MMSLPNFEIVSISPMHSDLEPSLAIAEVVVRVEKPLLDAADVLTLRVKFSFDETMPFADIKRQVMAEVGSSLRAASEIVSAAQRP